jgi:beta-hydroxylase
MQAIKDLWQVFREEGLKLIGAEEVTAANGDNDLGFHTFFKRDRKWFYLKWYDNALPSALALCAKSTAILDTISTIYGAMFATLPPGAEPGRHRDPFAGSLRDHLGLATPNSDAC